MQTELEAKFLDIDPRTIRQRLHRLGAQLVASERLMRRRNYDFPDLRLEQVGGWVRLRDEGHRITLSYKQLNDRSLHGTQEVSVTVDDFARTDALLRALGLQTVSYQETRRESWTHVGAEIEIDTWPWIPPFVELEGTSETQLRQLADQLGLDWATAQHGSVEVAYMRYYDVTEAEIIHWPEAIFSPVPDWLEAKRKAR